MPIVPDSYTRILFRIMITAERQGYSATRNSTFFKKVENADRGHRDSVREEDDDDDDDEDYIPIRQPAPSRAVTQTQTATPPYTTLPNQEGHGTVQPRRYPQRLNRKPKNKQG